MLAMPLAVPAMPEPSYILTYDDGGWYEGSFTDTLDEHGHGTEFYKSGNRRYEGDWKNGAQEGYGTEYYEDGKPLFVGWWRNGEYDCEQSGTFYSRDGRRLEFQPTDINGNVMDTIYRTGPA
jgi:antitoxin component YwqK of YwqJK toxin-antitoxin module